MTTKIHRDMNLRITTITGMVIKRKIIIMEEEILVKMGGAITTKDGVKEIIADGVVIIVTIIGVMYVPLDLTIITTMDGAVKMTTVIIGVM